MKRCDTCKFWRPISSNRTKGECKRITTSKGQAQIVSVEIEDLQRAEFQTSVAFGCLLHEEVKSDKTT